jgi:hypothetical protein
MQQSNQPAKFVLPIAQNDTAKADIPVTTADATRASQSLGFPPLTGQPPEAGGVPPQLPDMNGLLNAISRIPWWAMLGGRFGYDNAFATNSNINGYPLGAELASADGLGSFFSTVDNNVTNPDTNGAGWVPASAYGATALTGQTGGNVIMTQAQAAKKVITVSGTLTSNLVLIVPSWRYDWTVYNNTSGAFSVSVRTASGSAAAVPQNGAPTPVSCDGTNCALLAANIAPATSDTQAVRRDQIGGRLLNVQTFTASGSYTPTAGTTRVKVTVVGGGGGGGACATTGAGQTSVAASGGGGGYALSWIAAPVAGTAVTVGVGGARGEGATTAGQPGGNSSFAGVAASGGSGGSAGAAVSAPSVTGGADGGLGSGGNINNGRGTTAAPGLHMAVGAVAAGMSGSSLFGGAVANAAVGGASAEGLAGGAPGAGGSGGVASQSQVGRRGGDGAPGIVIIEEYA